MFLYRAHSSHVARLVPRHPVQDGEMFILSQYCSNRCHGGIELTDGKIPFTTPWLDHAECYLASLVGMNKNKDLQPYPSSYKEVNGVRWNLFCAGPAANIGYYVKELS
eukprot:scaffold2033_cov164-Amphora_coffeaeformis.AAC.10